MDDNLRLGGAGNKSMFLINGLVDCYISSPLCNWDICASESLLKGMGCHCTDVYNNKLIYGENNYVVNGLIMAKSQQMHETILRRWGK